MVQMTDFSVETVVIGAGVVGLAISRELSNINGEILVLESEKDFGQLTSSRNSGVIHAGIYYPENSLKSKFCIEGNILLYEYCKKYNIPHRNTKKILVASSLEQIQIIDQIKINAEKNGVRNIKKLTKLQTLQLEPLIRCEESLLVPSSGIVDAVSFMRSLEGQILDSGNMISYQSSVGKINFDGKIFTIRVLDNNNQETTIKCRNLINSTGLYATDIANKIEELKKEFVPKTFFAKGNYFSINKDLGIRHLVYPIPNKFSLGIHLTPELDYSVKFGPDFEWVEDRENYKVDINKKKLFINEIMKFLPDLDSDSLNPSYAGIRPIVEKKEKSKRDFIIQTDSTHSIPNLINLYGIESPGLTSSLAIALHVRDLLE